MDAPERGEAALHQIGNPADGHHRPDQHIEVGDEGDEITHADLAPDHQTSTENQHKEHPDIAGQGRNGEHQPLDHRHP